MPGFAFALEPIENVFRPKRRDSSIFPPGHDVVLEVVEIFRLSGCGNSARPPTSRSTKSLRHISANLPNKIAPTSGGLLATTADSQREGAAFDSARNLSRSISACFFPIASGPRLGPMMWRLRLVAMVPSGSSSSSRYRKNQ
jgi:hypothetical protein